MVHTFEVRKQEIRSGWKAFVETRRQAVHFKCLLVVLLRIQHATGRAMGGRRETIGEKIRGGKKKTCIGAPVRPDVFALVRLAMYEMRGGRGYVAPGLSFFPIPLHLYSRTPPSFSIIFFVFDSCHHHCTLFFCFRSAVCIATPPCILHRKKKESSCQGF